MKYFNKFAVFFFFVGLLLQNCNMYNYIYEFIDFAFFVSEIRPFYYRHFIGLCVELSSDLWARRKFWSNECIVYVMDVFWKEIEYFIPFSIKGVKRKECASWLRWKIEAYKTSDNNQTPLWFYYTLFRLQYFQHKYMLLFHFSSKIEIMFVH